MVLNQLAKYEKKKFLSLAYTNNSWPTPHPKLKRKNMAFSRIHRKTSFDLEYALSNGHTNASHMIKIWLNYMKIKNFIPHVEKTCNSNDERRNP